MFRSVPQPQTDSIATVGTIMEENTVTKKAWQAITCTCHMVGERIWGYYEVFHVTWLITWPWKYRMKEKRSIGAFAHICTLLKNTEVKQLTLSFSSIPASVQCGLTQQNTKKHNCFSKTGKQNNWNHCRWPHWSQSEGNAGETSSHYNWWQQPPA